MDEIPVSFVEEDFNIDETNISRSIHVTDFPIGTTPRELMISFQRPQNGGGDINSIAINHKKGAALITFDKEEVVQTVQRKEHKLRGVLASVKPYDEVRKNDQQRSQVLPQRGHEPTSTAEEKKVQELKTSPSTAKGAWSECPADSELKRLREQIEKLKLEQREREEHLKRDLERERNGKEESEKHAADLQTTLVAKENKVQELENSLSTAQRGLRASQRNDDLELRRFGEEIERFKLEKREREKHFERELKKERYAKHFSEQQTAKLQTTLTDKENKMKKLEEDISTTEKALSASRQNNDSELKRLREQIERLKLEQSEREGHFERELERERNGKEESEKHAADLQTTLVAKENKVQELENCLSTAQRGLRASRRNDDFDLRHFEEEIERFKLEKREREEHFERELEKERNAKNFSEQQTAKLQTTLTDKENKMKKLEEDISTTEKALSASRRKDDLELKRLGKKIERLKLEQSKREGHFERELERERNGKEESDKHAADLQTKFTGTVQGLEASLSTAEQALNECRRKGEMELTLSREEIERLKLEQRERQGRFESELEKERNVKKDSEQHAANLQTMLTDKESKEQELKSSLIIAERELRECRGQYDLELGRLRKEIERLQEEKENIENRCSEILVEKLRLEEETEARRNATEIILLEQRERYEVEQHAANLQTTLSAQENQLQELRTRCSEILAEKQRLEEETEARTNETERILLEQRERHDMHVANLQTTLTATHNQVQELRTNLLTAQRALEECRGQDDLELRRLRKVIERLQEEKESIENRCSEILAEKQRLEEETEARTNETERIVLEQRERHDMHVANLQSALTATHSQVQELQTRQRNETRDWVLSRDEIHLSRKVVGTGAWGTVYQGKFRGCKVAVKRLHEVIDSPHNRELFERESMIASKCRHPCLLQFIGATNDDGIPLFVTELMESSLRTQLERGALSDTDVTAIYLDVAQALNYLHLKEPSPIIHRDISSGNVLLWRQGDLWRGKVSDYGNADFACQIVTPAPGAPIYCAPEAQALTSNPTIKMDVYSFGVLLCEMCTRKEPQNRRGQVTVVKNQLLRNIIRLCIQPEPEARPSMEAIIYELE